MSKQSGEEKDPILQGLNPVQQEAVLFGEGPLLILAGAGSGKTRVLTRRIAHLILRREVPPDGVLAVTFTNKAAKEMRERVEALLGYDAAALWVGTFHSICLRWLRRHGERLGFPGRITVFDQEDQASLLKEILKEREAEEDSYKIRELQSLISLAKNRMWDPEDLERELGRPDRHRLASIYRDYQERLRRQGGADFDDLLLLAVRLMEGDKELGDRYAEKFLHILVDEYQDTNHVQFRLVRRLAQGHGNLVVVGDDDQSIYRWRGADVTNILEFERHFPEAQTLRMTQNYRSTSSILDLANAVIRHNRGRKSKSLWTENEAGSLPRLFVARDEEEEARFVVGRIRSAAQTGEAALGQTAILYRVHAQSRALEEACLNLSVPYVLLGGVLFYQRREVKDLLAYLRLAANPLDEVSFVRALSAPSRGIGKVGVEKILEAALAAGLDPAAACVQLTRESGVKGRALEEAHRFGRLLVELRQRLSEGAGTVLRAACEESGLLEWLRGSGEGDAEERVANVQELLQGAAYFQERMEGGEVEAYLDQVALYTNLDTRNVQGERITLMTVHNAKGLEFDSVYITGLEEGLFPHASSFDDPEEMEEERRLFYVAATRARRRLTLTASLDRRRMNRLSGMGLSRFLDEIPPELIEGTPSPAHRPSALFSGAPRRSAPAGPPEEPALRRPAQDWCGRTVRHAIFGVGKVESQTGEGQTARLSIVFPQVGRKKIEARFVQPIS